MHPTLAVLRACADRIDFLRAASIAERQQRDRLVAELAAQGVPRRDIGKAAALSLKSVSVAIQAQRQHPDGGHDLSAADAAGGQPGDRTDAGARPRSGIWQPQRA